MFDLTNISKPVTGIPLLEEPDRVTYTERAKEFLEIHSADTSEPPTEDFEKAVTEAFETVYQAALENYEKLKDVRLSVLRCSTDTVTDWRDRKEIIEAEFRVAQKNLREKYKDDLDHPVHQPAYQTKEYTKAFSQLIFDVCCEGIENVSGITHGKEPVDFTDHLQRKSFFASFVRLGLGGPAYIRVLSQQTLSWSDTFA